MSRRSALRLELWLWNSGNTRSPKYLRRTAKIYAVKLRHRSVPKSRTVTDLFTGIYSQLRKSALAIRLLFLGELADSRVIRGHEIGHVGGEP